MAQTLADRDTPDPQKPDPQKSAPQKSVWVVEVNIAGYRIRRRADKRRHLLGVPALRPSGAA